MVKLEFLLEGKTLSGAPEMPLGLTSPPLVNDEVKLLLSWLAMVEAVAAAIAYSCNNMRENLVRVITRKKMYKL